MGLYFKFQVALRETRGKSRQDCRLAILVRERHADSPSSRKENRDCFAEYRKNNDLFVRFGLTETKLLYRSPFRLVRVRMKK